MMFTTKVARLKRLLAAASSSACAVVGLTACVMQSTYDAAVQEGVATKTELARALEEQEALTRLVTKMELANADVVRDAEAAVAAVRLAHEEADHEHQVIDQRLAKLQQQLAQASKQQRALQYELTVAKENGAALQELIDGYQRKIRNGTTSSATETPVHKAFDPSTIPVPEDLPPAPAVTPPQPTPPPPAAPRPGSAARSSSPPHDDGWLASVTNWLLSLWRSVFS